MIELFYHTTPNARKVLMMLEEIGASYRIAWTDIGKGEQFSPEFRRINPNAKVPAIIDRDGPGGEPFALFESGAILAYLAEKSGRFLPADARLRHETMAWVFWQVGGQGPMSGQGAHFISHAPSQGIDIAYAKERYEREARRHYDVLERRLAEQEWIVGGDMTIADIAAFPWTRVAKGHGVSLDDYPNVRRWSDAIAARPSALVRPARDDGADKLHGKAGAYDADQWKLLFGDGQRSMNSHAAAGVAADA